MCNRRSARRPAAGLIRTLVVASASLAILLVCFAMYQYSQLPVPTESVARRERLPAFPAAPDPARHDAEEEGVALGNTAIGAGRNIKLTIYPREGTRARMELEVRDWTPRSGSVDEFLLVEPIIRLRTRDGNAVRVTAREGLMEARRKITGSLDPNRGRLTGDVVIEYDRLSEKDRQALPLEQRDVIHPDQLVRVETDEIAFDLDYGKLSAPGRVELRAVDVNFTANDLELRFNEAASRVETLRVGRGGRIELRGAGEGLGLDVPGMDAGGTHRMTLVDWLQQTLVSRLRGDQSDPSAIGVTPETLTQTADHPREKSPRPTHTPDGLPIFRPAHTAEAPQPEKQPVRYFARFEGDIDARQTVAGATQSRLQADILEVLRDFATGDRVRSAEAAKPPAPGTTDAQPAAEDNRQVIMDWSGRLVVEALADDDPRMSAQTSARLTATGSPARVSHPEGDAICERLAYQPDESEIWLFGSEDRPVMVRSAQQGSMSGLALYSQRDGETFFVRMEGPGTLHRDAEVTPDAPVPSWRSATASAEPTVDPGAAASSSEPTVVFARQLESHGQWITETSVNFTEGVTTRQRRTLNKAVFNGGVRMHQDDMTLAAEDLTLHFHAQKNGADAAQAIERLEGTGSVRMAQGKNQLASDSLDVRFAPGPDGRQWPKTALASGNVEAVHDQRTITARDTLTLDFEPAESLAANEPDAPADRPAMSVRRIQAVGDVLVVDPVQPLDLSAETLDCTVLPNQEIETALVVGTNGRPASVRLDTFTVSGRQIRLNVPDQWAEVPGEGRLTFRSTRDLSGKQLSQPQPVAVTWQDWMRYQGRDNRALFVGAVHATSQATTTFDADRLEVEFDDARVDSHDEPPTPWWHLDSLAEHFTRNGQRESEGGLRQRLGKEPAHLLATGRAVVMTSELDPATGELLTRARLAGPRLSVNLRPDVSRMLIEGAGNLQLEDFRPGPDSASGGARGGDLFDTEGSEGPSKTLIEWRDSMWYDFAIDQTRFEGQVRLKHFSGAQLARLFGIAEGDLLDTASTGRSTFLNADVLTVDFRDRAERARQPDDRRMGRLSTSALRQFQAAGSVSLQDQAEGLALWADRVIYERPRKLLAIYGTERRMARIVKQSPGRLPQQLTTERLFYNLSSGEMELLQPGISGR